MDSAPIPDSDALRLTIIRHILAASDEELAVADLSNETSLRDELDLSSMQAVALVMDLEDEFSITVEDEEIATLNSVGDVLQLIAAKQDIAG